MPSEFLSVDALPRRPASQVKNAWAPVARAVQAAGCVAITNHSTVEAVILSVKAYEELVAEAARGRAQQQQVLDELASRFKARLASLEDTQAGKRVDALFKARGKVSYRSKAGSSF